MVDTLGLLLMVKVVAADIQERDGAKQLLTKMNEERHRVPRLARIWAARFGGKIPPKSCLFDGGFSGPDFLHWVMDICHWIVDLVLRPNGSKGFVFLPKRWTVETHIPHFNFYDMYWSRRLDSLTILPIVTH